MEVYDFKMYIFTLLWKFLLNQNFSLCMLLKYFTSLKLYPISLVSRDLIRLICWCQRLRVVMVWFHSCDPSRGFHYLLRAVQFVIEILISFFLTGCRLPARSLVFENRNHFTVYFKFSKQKALKFNK